jgi:hypothetical protein
MAEPRKKSKRSPRPRRLQGPWVTYERCFLLTLGGLFSGLAFVGIKSLAAGTYKPPEWLPLVLVCLAMLGLFMIVVGFFGSRKDAGSLADQTSGHEAMFVVMILAAPLYYLLKAIEKRRKPR